MIVNLDVTYIYVINSSLGMSKGKIAAQVSHVAMMLEEKYPGVLGRAIVLKADDETFRELLSLEQTDEGVVIRDAGLTEVAPGTATCIGFKQTVLLKQITKNLKLV